MPRTPSYSLLRLARLPMSREAACDDRSRCRQPHDCVVPRRRQACGMLHGVPQSHIHATIGLFATPYLPALTVVSLPKRSPARIGRRHLAAIESRLMQPHEGILRPRRLDELTERSVPQSHLQSTICSPGVYSPSLSAVHLPKRSPALICRLAGIFPSALWLHAKTARWGYDEESTTLREQCIHWV